MLSVNTFSANSLNINTTWNLVLLASPSTHFLQKTLYIRGFLLPLTAFERGQVGGILTPLSLTAV